MTQVESTPPGAPVPGRKKASPLAAGVIIAAMIVLVVFVAAQVRTLWHEWSDLRGEMVLVERSAVIGYPNIHPNPSYAHQPGDWYRDEGEFTLLWARWDGGDHRWFRFGRGQVDRDHISHPMGRDVIQAIDYPLTERAGGKIWGRIPNEAKVVGFELDGTQSVYPIQVLGKVLVVNDLIGEHPFLIVFNPMDPGSKAISIYEPILDGHRVTLGMSGYFQDQKPVFYDRGTESLWVESGEGVLEAIAGSLKGSRLQSIARHTPVSWADWRGRHPASRLLIGADRSRSIPTF